MYIFYLKISTSRWGDFTPGPELKFGIINSLVSYKKKVCAVCGYISLHNDYIIL